MNPEQVAEMKLRIFTRILESNGGCVNEALSHLDNVYRAVVSHTNISNVVRDGEFVQTISQALKGNQ